MTHHVTTTTYTNRARARGASIGSAIKPALAIRQLEQAAERKTIEEGKQVDSFLSLRQVL